MIIILWDNPTLGVEIPGIMKIKPPPPQGYLQFWHPVSIKMDTPPYASFWTSDICQNGHPPLYWPPPPYVSFLTPSNCQNQHIQGGGTVGFLAVLGIF